MQKRMAQKSLLVFSLFASLLLLAPTCQNDKEGTKMQLTSSAFKSESMIPKIHTCEGSDQSPELMWSNLPAKTESLALIMEDPDATSGLFVHWVAWNIDPKAKGLKANVTATTPENIIMQGQNSAGDNGYKGPCPPTNVHRYFFKLYALDSKLNLPKSTTKSELVSAMSGHILQQTELMGKYEKANK